MAIGHRGLIRSLDRPHLVLHAEKLAGAAFEARVQEHTSTQNQPFPAHQTDNIFTLHALLSREYDEEHCSQGAAGIQCHVRERRT